MTQAVQLDISEDRVRLEPGAHRILMLTVTNIGRVPRQCRLIVSGLPPAWYDLADTTFALPIGGTSTTTLVLHPLPSTACPTGLYLFRVQVAGADGLEILDATVAAMTVGFVGDLRVEVDPVEAQGARGTFEVRVVNALPWTATVPLTVDYPPDALQLRLDVVGPLVIPAGVTQYVRMQVAPRNSRALQVGQRVDITVRGVQQQGDNVPDPHILQQVHFTYEPRRSVLALPPGLQQLPRWAAILSLILLLALAAVVGSNRLAASGLGSVPLPTNTTLGAQSPVVTWQQGYAVPPQFARPTVTSPAMMIATTTSTTSRPTPTRTSTPPHVLTPSSISTTTPLSTTITITF